MYSSQILERKKQRKTREKLQLCAQDRYCNQIQSAEETALNPFRLHINSLQKIFSKHAELAEVLELGLQPANDDCSVQLNLH